MTTLDSQTDNSLCHLDKLPHVEWDNLTPGSSGCTFPDDLSPLECQMAGHPFDGRKHTIGMLRRRNGHILKPATKAILGEREIAFYENLQTSQDPTIAQLKNFVPCYYGTTELKVFNKRTKFLTLKDITEGMAEPCVMDIKIGHRTWDPLATPEKRATEELKYAESKRAYGFCITGFQVYCLSTGRLKKFDRDYGKKLDAKGVVEALETFLNITPERPACRQLILQLLSFLWQIRLLFRTQRKFRFYSSSLLVAYDARRLRQHCVIDKDSDSTSMKRETKSTSFVSSGRTVSGAGATEETALFSTVSTAKIAKRNQIDAPMSPVLEKGVNVCNSGFAESIEDDKISNWSGSCSLNQKADCWLHPSYSTQSYAKNNDDIKNATLENDERIISITNEPHDSERDWVRLNMIDFTHVFPADADGSLDLNYLEGIENLFKLMETFLGDRKDSSEQKNCHISTMI